MKNELWAEYVDLYRAQVEAVFRYHLSRTGDWRLAQANTAETFLLFLGWFDAGLARSGLQRRILWRLALFVQERRLGRGDGERYSGDLLPGQTQLAEFAEAAKLSETWGRYPHQVADALALLHFGGLTPEEIGEQLGWKAERVRALPRPAQIPSNQPRPVGFFIRRLEAELQDRKDRRPPGRKIEVLLWQGGYRAGSLAAWGARVAALALVAVLAVSAWNSFLGAGFGPVQPDRSAPLPAEISSRLTPQPTEIVPALVDDLVVVDENGAVAIYSPRLGVVTRRISEEGFYPRTVLGSLVPPIISPDGRWLTLVRPRIGDTWLLPLNSADGNPRKLSDSPVRINWALNGGSAVFVDSEDPRRLMRLDVSLQEITPLVSLASGEILNATFAPSSDYVGLAYLKSGASNTSTLTLAMAVPSTSNLYNLETIPLPDDFSRRDLGLYFTRDGNELWFPAAYAALDIRKSEVRYLANQPANTFRTLPGFSAVIDTQMPTSEQLIFSPDENKVAMVLKRIDNERPGALAIYNGLKMDEKRWITFYGRIDVLNWTSDSSGVIVQRSEAAGPMLIYIDAETGESLQLRSGMRLVGVVERLREAAWKPARRSSLILAPEDEGGQWRTVKVPGGALTMRLPPAWSVWEVNGDGSGGSLAAANFAFADPFRFAVLPPGRYVLYVHQQEDRSGLSLRQRMEGAPGPDLGRVPIRPVEVNGIKGYRKDIPRPDGTYLPTVYLQVEDRLISIWFVPGIRESDEDLFQQILDSLKLDERAGAGRITTP